MAPEEYNPLDYENLTKHCVQELMSRGPFKLPLEDNFTGAGVYALFYRGSFHPYRSIRSLDAKWPIYVGKAVPPGARKGARHAGKSPDLWKRLREHVDSIRAAENLRIKDFLCRYLVVTPLWITMAERFLIEHYQPVWNICIEGFGVHNPGSGRHAGELSWWDTLHPGRPWATRLQQTRTKAQAEQRLKEFLSTYRSGKPTTPLSNEVIEKALEDEV
jgi:hypothetical protein